MMQERAQTVGQPVTVPGMTLNTRICLTTCSITCLVAQLAPFTVCVAIVLLVLVALNVPDHVPIDIFSFQYQKSDITLYAG